MRFDKVIFLLVFLLGDVAMAADDLEYYRSFFTNYRHPYGVKGRISKEEARNLKAYLVVRRDNKNRIISIQQLYDDGKKCRFHFEYVYAENGELYSFEGIHDCKPYAFTFEKIATEDNGNTPEYYRFVHTDTFPYSVSGRVSEKEAEKLESYAIIKRDKNNRIIMHEEISQGRHFFVLTPSPKKRTRYIVYKYKENGELHSFKYLVE
jgi:hypothetical protein